MDDEATLAALLNEDGGDSDDEDDDGGFQLDELLKSDSDSRSSPGLVDDLLEEDSDDDKGDDELLAALLREDDGSDDSDVGPVSASPTPLASASYEVTAPEPPATILQPEPVPVAAVQPSNSAAHADGASDGSSSDSDSSSSDDATPTAAPQQQQQPQQAATTFTFTSALAVDTEPSANEEPGLVGLGSPEAVTPRQEPKQERFELDPSGDVRVNTPSMDAGTPINLNEFQNLLETPLKSTPALGGISIAQQQQLQREERAAREQNSPELEEEEEEEEEVKRELLLIISVELTLQVTANADMYVVLSTKRSNAIWNEVGKTDEVQAAQAVAWSKRLPIDITHAQPEDCVKAEIFMRTSSGHDILLVEGETTVAVLDEHHKAEVRGTSAHKSASENYINFCAEVPDPNRIRWEDDCSSLRRTTVVAVEGSSKSLPQVPVALWGIIEDNHLAELRSTRPHFASEEDPFRNMIVMEIGKEQLDLAKARLNSGTGDLSEFGPHVCLGLFKHFISELQPSLLCTVYRSPMFRRLTRIRKLATDDSNDGASRLSTADLHTLLLRKPTRATALLVWVADRMLDLCGRVPNTHPYIDQIANVMAPLLYHDAPPGIPVSGFVAAVLRWRNTRRQFLGTSSKERHTAASQHDAIERLQAKEQDKRRRAAAKAVTQQTTAHNRPLFKDPKRVVAEDVNSLLKIDDISRLTNKMRALHEDTGGGGALAITELKIHQHWIAVGTQNGHIFVFDHFQEFKYRLVGPDAAVKCIDIDTSSHNISFLVASYANAALVLWDIQHNKQLHSYCEKRSLRGYADASQKAVSQAFFLPPVRDKVTKAFLPPQVLAIDVRNCVWVFKYRRFLTRYMMDPLEAINWPEKSALSLAAVLPPPKCSNPVAAQAAVVAVSLWTPKSETLVMLANSKKRFRVDQDRPLFRLPIESPTSTQETVVGVYLAWYWADDQPWPRLAQGYGNRLQIVASRNGEWKMQQEHRTPAPVAAICWLQKDLVLYFTSENQIAVYNVAERTRMAHLNLASATSKKSGYICGAASGRAKCYFAQVGGGLTLRAMQMRRVDETIQHFRDNDCWAEALSIGVHNWGKQPVALVARDAAELLAAFLQAKGEALQKAGAASVTNATKMAEGVVAMGLEFCLRFRNYLELLANMQAWARDRPIISPLFGRQLLSKLAAHASAASAGVLGVESPRLGDTRQSWDPNNMQVAARLPALNAGLLVYLLSLFPGGMHAQQIESFLLQVQWGVLGDRQTQVLREIMAFCLGHKASGAGPVTVRLPRLLVHGATAAAPQDKADYALPLLVFARVLRNGARPVLREHAMLLLHCCLNGLQFPNGPFLQKADALAARRMALACLFRPAQAHASISHNRFRSRLPKAAADDPFELLSALLENESTLGPTTALLRGVFCEMWEQQSKGYSGTDLSSGPPLQANDLVSAVGTVVNGWLLPSTAPPGSGGLDTRLAQPTRRRSMRAVCSLFAELHIMGLLLLRAHGAQPEVPCAPALVACLVELASNPRLKALYDKESRGVAITSLIHRLGQSHRAPERGPDSLRGDRCYATLMREGFHLPAAQYAQLRGCIEDALASYLAMGADAKCVFDFLLGQSKRVMRGANIAAARRRKQHGIAADTVSPAGRKPRVAPEDQYMYDRLCAAVTTVMAGLVLVDINKTKDIVMQLWGGLTLICIENLLDLHRPRALLQLLQGSTMRNDCDVEQVIHRARQAEAYEVVAWLRWTNGNSGDAENDLQEGMKHTLVKLRETAHAVQNMPAATPGTKREQLQQLHSHARESVEAIVDVAAQFCKLYWDRSSKAKAKVRGGRAAEEERAKAIFQGVLSKVLNTLTHVDKRLPNTPTPLKRPKASEHNTPLARLQFSASKKAAASGVVTPQKNARGLPALSLRVFLHDTTRRILSECQGRMPLHEVLNITLSDAADALKFSEIREMVNDMLQEVRFKQAALESCEEGASQQNYVGRLVRPIVAKEQEQRSDDLRMFQMQAMRDITLGADDQSQSVSFLFSQLHENVLQFPGQGMHGLRLAAPRAHFPASDRGDRPTSLPPPHASVTVSFS